MKYSRVLLKLSGETLAGAGAQGIHAEKLALVAGEIKKVYARRIQLAVVIGAGNLWRGAGKTIDRVTADHMGMLATVMNSLALRDALAKDDVPSSVLSAVNVGPFAETYSRDRAVSSLDAGRVVICAGGTGNPYFTTDTTAALRAAEVRAEVLLKATQVDGVYDDDPRRNPDAKRYSRVSFEEAIRRQLRVMDTAAFSLCRENSVPIIVFDFHRSGNLLKAATGRSIGTTVSE